MTIYILTLFPQIFDSIFTQSIVGRAIKNNILKINIINIRDFASDTHKTVDDKPYGGGVGMVMKVNIIVKALESIKPRPFTVLLSASGKKYTQSHCKSFSKKNNIALICGHYEGVDHRVSEYVDESISVGDYILTGGEIPSMILVDSVTRYLKGSINPASPISESFENGFLEYPQFTRPAIFRSKKVPDILLEGNHKKINLWRNHQSKIITKKNRPDLLKIKKV